MDIRITFPGGKKVEAAFGHHLVRTDQSEEHGGQGSAPEPFELFLASLGTCAGFYVMSFCQTREIPTAEIQLVQRHRYDDEHRLTRVELQILLPADFPERYRDSVVRAAAGCKVKKLLAAPPEIAITAQTR